MKCECRNWANDVPIRVTADGREVYFWVGDICPDCNTEIVRGWW